MVFPDQNADTQAEALGTLDMTSPDLPAFSVASGSFFRGFVHRISRSETAACGHNKSSYDVKQASPGG
ncbi:UNVERIFIED_CONTAM: hypothetical protein FKN15_033127 [Acipenser sinensis]